ncbi:MAG TPA: ABC transporter transmembrane domain-containing protein, partial [Candidatus Fermentibacter sp.]|nr:ABC transporter transmembrane domain-containing protein [Candidatus Fermentibacter sp.]
MLRARRPAAPGRIEEARDPKGALARLAGYLRPYRGALAIVLLMVAGYTLLGLAGPWLTSTAIDGYIIPGRIEGLGAIALAMLASYLLSDLLHALADRRMAVISQESLMLLRRDLFARLQVLPVSFFDRTPAGELMSRLTNDIDAINQAVSQ